MGPLERWAAGPSPRDHTKCGRLSDPGLLSSLPFVGLRSVNLLADDVVLIDGIAHGETWADVFAKRFSAPLPVELAAFEATTSGQAVTLRWATAGETNNAGFEIQRRQGASRYERVAYVEGAGTTVAPQNYTHRLDHLAPGLHTFRLKQIDVDGAATYSPEIEVAVELPSAYLVEPAYPNPFHQSATLRFGVQQTQRVEVAVYDVLGRRVRTLFEGVAEAGAVETLTLDGDGLPSGTYLVRVSGADVRTTQRVMLLK
ncbi:MAG: T9SS type A sorting domain-containing protein [Rhodothermales bacterium]